MNDASNPQLLKLSMLLLLEQRLRNADKGELPFIIANETAKIVSYQQAILWQPHLSGKKQIRAVSGVTTPDPHGPFFLWFKKNLPAIRQHINPKEIAFFSSDQLPRHIRHAWDAWFPPHALWAPLPGPDKGMFGVLVMVRPDPFHEGDKALMQHLSGAFGHALAHENATRSLKKNIFQKIRKKTLPGLLLVIFLVLFFVPIKQFTLTSAEVVPVDPVIIRSPLDGLIKTFFRKPNDVVTKGDALFELDDIKLISQRNIAAQRLKIAKAELLQAQQMAFNNMEAKARIPILNQRIALEQAELNYINDLLKRIVVHASQDGILIFEDPDEWIGRPVEIGQKILLLADPGNIELKISMPVQEAVELGNYGPVDFFLNISPAHPFKATVNHISYSTHITLENTVVYRIWASFSSVPETARIGLQGTAKVYGPSTRLGLWALRKPINLIHRWVD